MTYTDRFFFVEQHRHGGRLCKGVISAKELINSAHDIADRGDACDDCAKEFEDAPIRYCDGATCHLPAEAEVVTLYHGRLESSLGHYCASCAMIHALNFQPQVAAQEVRTRYY